MLSGAAVGVGGRPAGSLLRRNPALGALGNPLDFVKMFAGLSD